MLFDLDDNPITGIPHKRQNAFEIWRKNLSDTDYDRVVSAIADHIADKDIFTSSFLPGYQWTGTPYEPLFHACTGSREHAGFFFGLIVWQVVIGHDDEWIFKPSDKNSDDPLGTTYWRRDSQ